MRIQIHTHFSVIRFCKQSQALLLLPVFLCIKKMSKIINDHFLKWRTSASLLFFRPRFTFVVVAAAGVTADFVFAFWAMHSFKFFVQNSFVVSSLEVIAQLCCRFSTQRIYIESCEVHLYTCTTKLYEYMLEAKS